MKPLVPLVRPEGAKFIELGVAQEGVAVLPCYKTNDGFIMTEWEMTAQEAAKMLAGGRLRMWTRTGDGKFQPVAFEVV